MKVTDFDDDFVEASPPTAMISPQRSSGSGKAHRLPDLELSIEGMMCQKNCASTVRKAIEGVRGVQEAVVTYATGQASVWLVESAALEVTAAVCEAVEVSGYDVVRRVDNRCGGIVGDIESNARDRSLSNKSPRTATSKAERGEKEKLNSSESHLAKSLKTGPGLTKREFVYSVQGMSCGACAVKVEKAMKGLPGVVDAAVSVMTHQGRAVIDDSVGQACGPRDVIDAVRALGYDCALIATGGAGQGIGAQRERAQRMELAQWWRLLWVSLIFGVPVMVLHFGMAWPLVMNWLMQPVLCGYGVSLDQVLMLLLNLPILLLVGARFYRAAFLGLWHGMMGMDLLVVTGSTITFVYSLADLFVACQEGVYRGHVFFEIAGMLLMFVTIGKYIEAYARGKSASSIAELLKLQPTEAYIVTGESARLIKSEQNDVVVDDAHVKRIPVDLIQKGDIVKVLPGGRIPTDGEIVLGSTHVDESMITGESLPVARSRGDEVFGSTVNQEGCVYVRVTSYGSDSALAQIVRLVESAQMSKAPVQDYADRIAGLFTPAILFLAAVTFAVWLALGETDSIPQSWLDLEDGDPFLFALMFAIAVVVISCPCALGLATPTAIMVGTTVGAKNGILIKGGLAFEVAHKVDTIVFDKTGTLTEGRPSVSDVLSMSLSDSAKVSASGKGSALILLAATAEQRSEHPLAKAILRAAREKYNVSPLPLPEDAALSFAGGGVSCDCALGRVFVGNRQFVQSRGITVSVSADMAMRQLEQQGKTAVLIALDDEVQGVLGIADVPKPEAVEAVRALRALGVDVWLCTGDNATTAQSLARKLGFPSDRVMAGMLPQDKARKAKELQAEGHVVAMVGDGVNDSPALAQADLGVAIGAGTQIAIEAASMVLIRSDLRDLVVAFDLAKAVFARIRWNFMWATVYNVLAVPLAAGVWFPWMHITLPPYYAALAMAVSSVSVVLSSMMLRFYKRPSSIEKVKKKPEVMDDFPQGYKPKMFGRFSTKKASRVVVVAAPLPK